MRLHLTAETAAAAAASSVLREGDGQHTQQQHSSHFSLVRPLCRITRRKSVVTISGVDLEDDAHSHSHDGRGRRRYGRPLFQLATATSTAATRVGRRGEEKERGGFGFQTRSAGAFALLTPLQLRRFSPAHHPQCAWDGVLVLNPIDAMSAASPYEPGVAFVWQFAGVEQFALAACDLRCAGVGGGVAAFSVDEPVCSDEAGAPLEMEAPVGSRNGVTDSGNKGWLLLPSERSATLPLDARCGYPSGDAT